VFAPIGGFQAVTDAVERLASDLGVEVKCNTMVTSIRRNGVFVTDESNPSSPPMFVPADLIIVNADRPYATKSLLSDDDSESLPEGPPTFDWDDQFSFSSGVISFHWSIGKRLDDLNTHNVFMIGGSRSQAEASWEILRTNQGDIQKNSPFNFYVHRASKVDPTAAPEECDSIMVLVPCRTLLRDEDCAQLPREEALRRYKEQFSDSTIAQAREAVLARLSAVESLQNLDQWILDEVVDTPATWADQFHLAAGTPFALVRFSYYKVESIETTIGLGSCLV
jgi:phytoene desaturase (3,4-didehydrolycopene-forming)